MSGNPPVPQLPLRPLRGLLRPKDKPEPNGPQLPEPIALRDSKGVIRAWACPRCRRVRVNVECGGSTGRKREAEASYEQAKECGVCRSCGRAAAAGECQTFCFGLNCEACRQAHAAKAAADYERDRPNYERQRAEREARIAAQNAELLKDIPALLSRDWDEHEDLASQLMPDVLKLVLTLKETSGDGHS